MGGDLFDRHPDLCATADRVLGYSIRELCLHNPGRRLRHTQFTQPALYVANALTWLDRLTQGPPPTHLAGHSLGEYNALLAAGCFDFETGLRLVAQRGALMARVQDGGMAAVLGLGTADIQTVLDDFNARHPGGEVDIANHNAHGQLVLSGPQAALEALLDPLERAGAHKCIVLNVSGAFHSRHMVAAGAELERHIRQVRFAPPQIEVIANTTARPYTADTAADLLVAQVSTPVRWAETMDHLRSQGITAVEELGPGKVLTKLWARSAPAVEASENPATEAPTTDTVSPPGPSVGNPAADQLGDAMFRREYGVRYAYVAGSPMPGTRTPAMAKALARAGLLGLLDAFPDDEPCAVTIRRLVDELGSVERLGVSVRPDAPFVPGPHREADILDAALDAGLRNAEAMAYAHPTPALVRFRFHGAHRTPVGQPVAVQRLLVHVGSADTAQSFLDPAPTALVDTLVNRGALTADEGAIARELPVASDLCTHADGRSPVELTTLLPTLQRLRDRATERHGTRVRVGAGGALGTPEALACAFFLGADFVLPGAVHLTSPESGLPSELRHRLATLQLGDTTNAPAADGFSFGARAPVVKKGTFFPARAQKLHDLFRFYGSLDAIPRDHRNALETHFDPSLASLLPTPNTDDPIDGQTALAEAFTHYFRNSLRWTLEGNPEHKLDHQIPCDESLAAFNLFVEGSDLEDPAKRGVVAVAQRLMQACAERLKR